MADMHVSIVIPTRDRWAVLAGTLAALERQDLGGASVQTIVVDNGSRDPAPTLGDGVLVVREPVPGAAAARNAGIAAAESSLIVFLGDDCRPVQSSFVRGHIDAHAAGDPRLAVVGGIEPDPALRPMPVMRWLERTGKLIDSDAETFYTGNLSLRREALLWVAGFDERFSGYGWEDEDLGLRLGDHGVRLERRPDLTVHHHHVYDEAASLARMEAMGRGAHLLERLHDHRRPLPGPRKSRLRMAAAPLLPGRRAAHLAAFAGGYAAAPLVDDPRGRGYGRFPVERPPVSVIVPFLGSRDAGEELRRALGALELRPGDELIVVDNSPGTPVLPGATVHATAQRSSYYARNVGVDRAANDWLLFVDADCRPRPTLIDDYFAERIDERCGAVAGRVMAAAGQDAPVARYARSRGHLSQAAHLRDPYLPFAITANLLVRRAAFEEVGGFQERLRSGGDQDLSWRLQDAGWSIAYREPAAVWHSHRERLVALARQAARYAAAAAWMERHRPGSSPRPPLGSRLGRAVAGVVVWSLFGRFERARFKALDGVVVLAEAAGWLFGNAAPQSPLPSGGAALVAGAFPDADAPVEVPGGWVEAARRPARPDREAARGIAVFYEEDDGWARRAWEAGRRSTPAARRLRRADGLVAAPGAEERGAALAALTGLALDRPRSRAAEPAYSTKTR